MNFKFKIKKSFKKRFLLKGNNTNKAMRPYKKHLLTKKSSNIKRNLRSRIIFKNKII